MVQTNLIAQVFNDLKVISIGSMDFDNPKVYGDTSITGGLVDDDEGSSRSDGDDDAGVLSV